MLLKKIIRNMVYCRILLFGVVLSFTNCNQNISKKNVGIMNNLKKLIPTLILLVDNYYSFQENIVADCVPDGANCTNWLNCCYGTCLNGKCYSSQGAPCNETENCFNDHPYYNYTCQNIYKWNTCEVPNINEKTYNEYSKCPSPCVSYVDCTTITCLNNCCCSSEKAPCNYDYDCCLYDLGLYKCIKGKCEATNSTISKK